MSESKPKQSFWKRFSNESAYERKKARLLKKLDKSYVASSRRKELADLEDKIRQHKMENRKAKRKVKIGGYNFSI